MDGDDILPRRRMKSSSISTDTFVVQWPPSALIRKNVQMSGSRQCMIDMRADRRTPPETMH